MNRTKIVVFTGSGISAESGIKTFRDSGGLWEEYDVYEVATPAAWEKNPALVQEFYNQRRKQVLEAAPNPAHKALVKLEEKFDVHIVTQNVDDLHERAGSRNVLHLHGEIRKARSTKDPRLIYEIQGWELKMEDTCALGFPLRPHIVWFGEQVPAMPEAAALVETADIFIVIGTSLNVYPAAGLTRCASRGALKYLVDPAPDPNCATTFRVITEKAGTGVPLLVEELLKGER